MLKKICAMILTVAVLACTVPNMTGGLSRVHAADVSYKQYKDTVSQKQLGNVDYLQNGDSCIGGSGERIASYTDKTGKTENNLVKWENDTENLVYKFNIAQEGLYNFTVKYLAFESNSDTVSFGIKIDGGYPFGSMKELTFFKVWKDGTELESGSETVPSQIQSEEFVSADIFDPAGIEGEPYLFYMTSGEHTVELVAEDSAILISQLGFTKPETTVAYSEKNKEYKKSEMSAEPIVLEAERAYSKNSKSLIGKSDNSSPEVTPSDPVKRLINYIGDSNWSSPNSEISWKIDVTEGGLYKIGFAFKQEANINSYSYRTLKIDGKVPFEECKSIGFNYGIGWQSETIGADGEDWLFYLEKGEHILSLTATLGETASYYQALSEVTSKLGDMYLDIAMITGESPDVNRDYELFKQIPNFNESLSEMKQELDDIAQGMSQLASDNTTTFVTAIKNMSRILQAMVDNPYSSHEYVKDYYNAYTTVSSWLYDMKSMPLCLDQIIIAPADTEIKYEQKGFFEKFFFGLKRFAAAFGDDYNAVRQEKGEKEIKIWVNWGRDQAMVLNNLISENFTPKTGISVNLEITNATLINGILAGNAPDLSLHMARTEPVNLALRGSLVDLSKFSDYEEVCKSFGETASIPYRYNGGVYALPDTQSFYLMFYRKDVLDNLGIAVPETWDDFLTATGVLQRNNMRSWIPYTQITTAGTVNTGVGGLNLFMSILQQYGESIYNDELNACTLNSDVALEAFTYWTNMYTKYKIPTTASFYNRFRVGTMPLGIEAYTLYTQLDQAAPELEGRWGVSLVPGIRKSDGSVDHTVSGSGTGCAIIAMSKAQNEAWEFLKWWTSAEVQLSYNNNVETILGTVARTTTANLEAFSNMSWQKDDLNILLEQRSWIKEVPEVPGSYYVSRSVDQAFWNVVNDGRREKDMLDKWGNIATKEIKRKIAEYANK